MICMNCQHEIPDDSKFCPFCGSTQQMAEPAYATPVTSQPQVATKEKKKPIVLIIIIAAILLLAIAIGVLYYTQQNDTKNNEPLTPCNLRLDMNRKQVKSVMKTEPYKVENEAGKATEYYNISYSDRPAKFDPKNDWGKYVDSPIAVVTYKTTSENSNIDGIHFLATCNDLSTERLDVVKDFVDYCNSILDNYDYDSEDNIYRFYWFDDPGVYFDCRLKDIGDSIVLSVYNRE